MNRISAGLLSLGIVAAFASAASADTRCVETCTSTWDKNGQLIDRNCKPVKCTTTAAIVGGVCVVREAGQRDRFGVITANRMCATKTPPSKTLSYRPK